jgi:hypothetical protein
MPKKITNIYKQGSPSKLYYLAYSEPKSIYKISKEIYGKPQPQKLYKYKDMMVKENTIMLEKKSAKSKWISTSKPILKEIEEILSEKTLKLDSFEKKVIKNLIESPSFRLYVKSLKIDSSNEINAVREIIQVFDLFLIQTLSFRMNPKTIQHAKRRNMQLPWFTTTSEAKKAYAKYQQKIKDGDISKNEIKYTSKEQIKDFFNHNSVSDTLINQNFKSIDHEAYSAFLSTELMEKLLLNKDKKFSSLSALGNVFLNMSVSNMLLSDLAPFLLEMQKKLR